MSKKSIKEKVLKQIHSGRAKMRPRWHFVLKTSFIIVGAGIVILALLYLVSFILFILRQTGVWFVPIFGFRALGIFFTSLPWFLIIASIIFIFILEILAARYSFAYQKPLLYSVTGIIVLVLIGGLVVSQIGLHQGLFRSAEEKRLPMIGHFYRRYAIGHPKNVFPGAITKITENSFEMTSRQGESVTVAISAQTRFPLGTNFQEGDRVVVWGEKQGDTIRALGIRKIDDEMRQFMSRPKKNSPFIPRLR